jgi:hypothetical protein
VQYLKKFKILILKGAPAPIFILRRIIMGKKWYTSKIIWVNMISLIAIVLQTIYDKEILNPSTQLLILSFVNMLLRIITNESIEWKNDSEK